MARCSICHTLVQGTDETLACPKCEQTYHATCWTELGGCATYGCAKAVAAEKPPPAKVVGSGWGDSKKCPVCRKEIGPSLLICLCGARFPYADPMDPAEYRTWREEERQRSGARTALLVLFIVSLAGLPAPITGVIAGYIAYTKRTLLAGADGTYLAMGYGAVALGATYTIVALMLMMGAVISA